MNKNIKYLRRTRSWTQTEFGRLIDASKGSVSSYEKAINQPTIDTLIKMAQLFEISIDDLLFRNIAEEGIAYKTPPIPGRVEEPSVQEMNRLLKLRINELEREIRRNNPDLADELGITG
ncbi:helix-turn-helix transcriptional regulator [Flavilitoribacter nigricans]|uniref:helix-turn-helix transcriptional regulator n=1 Tax=Flavilitoribacter nigricans TaxID=70997 RepID=UPI001475CB90|nr:helix-turn-helix transcriptional regulator [Flavilitoribacter nigricans]